jgi:chromosome segregation ATPase
MKENKQYEKKTASLEDFYTSLKDIEKSNKELLESQNKLREYIDKFEGITGSTVSVSKSSRVDRQVAESSFYSFFVKVDLLQETENEQHKELDNTKSEHNLQIEKLHKELGNANDIVNVTESQIASLRKKIDTAKTLKMLVVMFVMTTGIIVTLMYVNIVSTLFYMMLALVFAVFAASVINKNNA